MTIRDWIGIALVVVAAFFAWSLIGQRSAVTEAVARADVADSIANVHRVRADSLAEITADLSERADSLAEAYAADSARWNTENAEKAAEASRARQAAQRTAVVLRESLDSAQTALLDEYEARMDSVVVAKDEIIESLEAERASLWEQRETLGELVAVLRQENMEWKETAAALTQANAALRAGIRSSTRENRVLKLAGTGLLGLAIYDRLSGA